MMKFALFIGCNIPARLSQYESSAKAVLKALGVEFVDIEEFNCCGYPLKNIDHEAFVLSAARNLALAAREGLDIMSLCKCCYGGLKKANHLLKEDVSLREEVNKILRSSDGLQYDGNIEVKHLLSILYHDVGIQAIKEKIEKSYSGLNIATHYGCHALRPSKIVAFDDPVEPSLFDQLVEATGATSVGWDTKLECCGAPLLGINDDLSMDLTEKKLADGKKSGAHYLCTACPYCQMQFDTVQKRIRAARGSEYQLPSILYTQLLALRMGVEKELLGLDMTRMPLEGVEHFFVETDDREAA
jgi:heterodisulfide reductase subunit B